LLFYNPNKNFRGRIRSARADQKLFWLSIILKIMDLEEELLEAVKSNNVARVRELLGRGANPNARERNRRSARWTALHYAAFYGYTEIARLLIERGARVNAGDRRGRRPIHLAVNRGHLEVVELLVESGARIDKIWGKGTPLHYAVLRGDPEMVKLLLEKGANPNAQGKYGASPLHYATEVKVAEILLERGADINARDRRGQTPLHYAVLKNRQRMASFLIEKGADVNARDNRGRTPLHYAVLMKNKQLVELLLKAGTDVNMKDYYGKTPLDLAYERRLVSIAKVLEKFKKPGD
jgi:ankyrin repeat protein